MIYERESFRKKLPLKEAYISTKGEWKTFSNNGVEK